MVHSIIAASDTGKVKRDFLREDNSSAEHHKTQNGMNFSQVLQQEVEERQKESVDCHTSTYGSDRRIHNFDYCAREYHY